MSVVFVGNIPYDYTEEQLTEIFKQIGPVKNFRLVFDKENGRGKGYGFCEYLDAGNAQSAVRNLDGYDVGNRQLRVAFSDSDSNNKKGPSGIPTPSSTGGMGGPPPPQAIPPAFAQQFARGGSLPPPLPVGAAAAATAPTTPGGSLLPPLPAGTQPPARLAATDAISNTLSAMQPNQLLDVITQFKALVLSNPAQAEALLKQAPSLSYAVLQALLMMNLVDAKVLARVISSGGAASMQQQQTPTTAVVQPVSTDYRNSPAPQQAYNSPAPQQAYHSPAPAQQQQQQQHAQARQPTPQRDPNTAALIAQVMALTDAQIGGLPQEQRTQIMMIKQQVAAGLM